MSSKAKRRRVIDDEEEDQEDQDAESQVFVEDSQPTKSSHEGPSSFSDRTISDIARLFIFKASRDEFVRGLEIKALRPVGDTRSIKVLVQNANAVLFDVFGMEIVSLPRSNDTFMLRTQLKDAPIASYSEDSESLERLGLASAVCALLKFSGGRVRESQVNSFISEHLGFTPSMEQLKDLVQHKYLQSVAVDGEQTEYILGPRATIFLGEITASSSPIQSWINSINL
jgi:hypothetical protein